MNVLYNDKLLPAKVTRATSKRIKVVYDADNDHEVINGEENIADRVSVRVVAKKKRNGAKRKPARRRKRKIARTNVEPISQQPKLPQVKERMIPVRSIGAEGIGYGVRIYFDLDDVWYFGRIEKHKVDSKGRHLHQVVYTFDNEHDWVCLAEVRCMCSSRVGWAKMTRYPPCPAEIFEVVTAFEADKKQINKNRVLAYFWNTGKVLTRSYAWIPKKNVTALETTKPTKKYAAAYAAATKECALRSRKHIASLTGSDLVGYGVSVEHDAIFERPHKSGARTSSGVVRGFHCLTGKNFVVFDDIDLRPKWLDFKTIVPTKVFSREESTERRDDEDDHKEEGKGGDNINAHTICRLCLRSASCYAVKSSGTGRKLKAEHSEDVCRYRQCSACRRLYHEMCCIDAGTPASDNSTDVGWKCHRCIACDSCGRLSRHESKPFTLRYQVKHSNTYDDVLSYLPVKSSVTLCAQCVSEFDREEYCPYCQKTWSFDDECRKTMSRDDESVNRTYRRCEKFMIQCDRCDRWSHAKCDPQLPTLDAYEALVKSSSNENWSSDSYQCPLCRYADMGRTHAKLLEVDYRQMFRTPVTEEIAPNYFDVVDVPMDLSKMRERLASRTYRSMSDFREDFAQMCLNAITYNSYGTLPYRTAVRFFKDGLAWIVHVLPQTQKGEIERRTESFIEQKRVKNAQASERRVKAATLAREENKRHELRLTEYRAFNVEKYPTPRGRPIVDDSVLVMSRATSSKMSFLECCDVCNSFGESSKMVFCVDCGLARHFFCARLPAHRKRPNVLHRLGRTRVEMETCAHWRCENCAVVCELCGDACADVRRALRRKRRKGEAHEVVEARDTIRCKGCNGAFHAGCLDPSITSTQYLSSWYCAMCVKCVKCARPFEASSWSSLMDTCRHCTSAICFLCEEDKGSTIPMVQCDACEAWVHIECTDLKREDLQLLAHANSSYLCVRCLSVWNQELVPTMNKIHRLREGLRCSWSARRRSWTTRRRLQEQYAFLSSSSNKGTRELALTASAKLLTSDGRNQNARRQIVQSLTRRFRGNTDAIPNVHEMKTFGSSYEERSRALRHKPFSRMIPVWAQQTMVNAVASECDRSKEEHAKAQVAAVNDDDALTPERPATPPISSVAPNQTLGTTTQVTSGVDKKSCNGLSFSISRQRCASNLPSGAPLISDARQCSLCQRCGDLRLEGRLLQIAHGSSSQRHKKAPMAHETEWVHANCAIWSSECHEDEDSCLHKIHTAISRGRKIRCGRCGLGGGTVGCFERKCKRSFHFACAVSAGWYLGSVVYCSEHRQDEGTFSNLIESEGHDRCLRCVDPSVTAAKRSARKRTTTKSGRTKSNGGVSSVSESPGSFERLCFDDSFVYRIGALTVHALGRVATNPCGGCFHSDDLIYPVGFTSTRLHWHLDGTMRRCLYVCRVLRRNKRPVFVISAVGHVSDDPDLSEDYFTVRSTQSADDATEQFYDRLHASRLRRRGQHAGRLSYQCACGRTHTPQGVVAGRFEMNGAQFFGFGIERVAQAIECLSDAARLALPASLRPGTSILAKEENVVWPEYHFHGRRPNTREIETMAQSEYALVKRVSERVVSKSGCARCEPCLRQVEASSSKVVLKISRPVGARLRHASSFEKDDVVHASIVSRQSNKDSSASSSSSARTLMAESAKKYFAMKAIPWEQRVLVKRSNIHGWGVFVRKDFKAHDMIVEFTGEIIRAIVADRREKKYESEGMKGCYMFRLDADYIIDGTRKGNITRFTNHSCDPNAYVKIVDVGDGLSTVAANNESESERKSRPVAASNKKIIFFAKIDLPKGTELLYDYQYALEDDNEIVCNCQSVNCRGRMN